MSRTISLNGDWVLSGYRKNGYTWGEAPLFCDIPATVPGAVQADLVQAGLMPDPLIGLNSNACEWTEHRQWMLRREFTLPEEKFVEKVFLCCEGLDHSGTIFLNGEKVAEFCGMLSPLRVDITGAVRLRDENNISILFNPPPETEGQIGYTQAERTFKARYAYGWDWCPRMVSTGIWDDVSIKTVSGLIIDSFFPKTTLVSGGGEILAGVEMDVQVGGRYQFVYRVLREDAVVDSHEFLEELRPVKQVVKHSLRVENPAVWDVDAPELYTVRLVIERGQIRADSAQAKVGFRDMRFERDAGQPSSYPYRLKLNGRELFLQGANWVPLRMYPGTVTREMLEPTLRTLKNHGVQILRVWGGATLERSAFYDLCDELGMLVWQEFPLSSSGLGSRPPEDDEFVMKLSEIAASYVRRRRHHACLAVWSGGNELMHDDGSPLDMRHPAIAALGRVVKSLDEGRLFLPTSPLGPIGMPTVAELGRGLCHDVHGPWQYLGHEAHYDYYNRDDSLLRSETGCPAAARPELIRAYSGEASAWPAKPSNALWRHRGAWWNQWEQLSELFGPYGDDDIELYCRESRYLQAEGLRYVAESCRRRAQSCAGFFAWMANEPFPNFANTSVLDFDGAPRPSLAAIAATCAKVHVSARYSRLSYRPDSAFSAEVYITASAPKGERYRVEARLLRPRGEELHSTVALVAATSVCVTCGVIEYPLGARDEGAFILALTVFGGDAPIAHNAYAFCCAAEGPPLAYLRRLPAARVSLREADGAYSLCNEGADAAVGVCAFDNAGLTILPGFVTLLPWEKRSVVLVGSNATLAFANSFRLEGLNLGN